ncbi:MAG: hypothetical protein IKP23_00200 [Elusimicrobiaceae bacterium]|nr:hypothetical protein [Elusimicrobiaceae bacterium]
MAKNSVLIVGSIAFDSIKTHKASAKNVLGGSASYSSISASFFAPTKLVAIVGKDFSKKHIDIFKKRGINLESLEIKEGKTFTWSATYDKDFKNATTLSTKLNVFSDFCPKIKEQDRDTKVVFLANIAPSLQLEVLKQLKGPRLIACDTMNLWINNNKPELLKLLKKVHILFVNEAEARQLTGSYNLIEAGRKILKMGPQIAVIKLGPHGALLVSKDCLCQIPPYLVEYPKDTTGAGDSFGGGFVGYLASVKNWHSLKNIKRALAMGSVMASFAIESFSVSKLASVDKTKIDKRLKEYLNASKI